MRVHPYLARRHPERNGPIRLRIGLPSRRTHFVTTWSSVQGEIVDTGVASIWAIDSHQQTQGPSTARTIRKRMVQLRSRSQLVTVTVAVRMGMKFARRVRVPMGMNKVRGEKQRVVVENV